MRPEELPERTKLIQLAEESAELAQAALKLIRSLDGDTPVSEVDARDHLREEIADVKLCADVLTSKADDYIVKSIYAKKYRRWEKRINGIVV
jgi:NTP pyrophosphatase (non-canonical NTP hydrolase)